MNEQDNYPRMDLTMLDLSPYYLLEARKNLQYWADKRAPSKALGGADGTGCSYLQAPAEAIPQPDASFDVVRPSVNEYLIRPLALGVVAVPSSWVTRWMSDGQ